MAESTSESTFMLLLLCVGSRQAAYLIHINTCQRILEKIFLQQASFCMTAHSRHHSFEEVHHSTCFCNRPKPMARTELQYTVILKERSIIIESWETRLVWWGKNGAITLNVSDYSWCSTLSCSSLQIYSSSEWKANLLSTVCHSLNKKDFLCNIFELTVRDSRVLRNFWFRKCIPVLIEKLFLAI